MEARLYRAAVLAAGFLSLGAGYRTPHFVVTAPTAELAQEIALAGEKYRRDLAVEWLGKELPPWSDACPVTAHVSPHLGAGGATSFMFERGRPFGWTMTIQGSRERLLDSVLPHEITHMIFATHFGQPLPRWADEGACTTVEHVSERTKQENLLIEFLKTGRGIAFNQMFAMKEYPPDMLPLYSQGYSLARFLIDQGGKPKFLDFVGEGMESQNWSGATRKHYGYRDLSQLQVTWLDWVRRGCPTPAAGPQAIAIAQASAGGQGPAATRVGEESRATVAGPPVQGTASLHTAASGGWYARVRDEAATRRNPMADARGGVGSGKGSNDRALEARQAVSRPQPSERPQQVVLEWIHPHVDAGPPQAMPESAAAVERPRVHNALERVQIGLEKKNLVR